MRKIRVLVGKPASTATTAAPRWWSRLRRRRHGSDLHRVPPDARTDRGRRVQEDVDVGRASVLSGAHMTLFPTVLAMMKARGIGDRLLTGGGIIPPDDMETLEAGRAACWPRLVHAGHRPVHPRLVPRHDGRGALRGPPVPLEAPRSPELSVGEHAARHPKLAAKAAARKPAPKKRAAPKRKPARKVRTKPAKPSRKPAKKAKPKKGAKKRPAPRKARGEEASGREEAGAAREAPLRTAQRPATRSTRAAAPGPESAHEPARLRTRAHDRAGAAICRSSSSTGALLGDAPLHDGAPLPRGAARAAAPSPVSPLDLGCGRAYGTHWARTLGCEVAGIDPASTS